MLSRLKRLERNVPLAKDEKNIKIFAFQNHHKDPKVK
jgi:hypothetical protein